MTLCNNFQRKGGDVFSGVGRWAYFERLWYMCDSKSWYIVTHSNAQLAYKHSLTGSTLDPSYVLFIKS